ncbi:hypothetical protein [Blastopirellula marina]|uniref:Uncharacterized protein n=1 Tax=Blastopirellula marina TaxID=124 RepID=A0A2S8G1N5_9BACT|nr:hypothetical protein [Blastopirellula marina]PQO38356.1 hypothetical protein C5Y98_09830 [Blastopirellula marina]PTL45012.1 hypothetical protein C5Y97_09835 [Blastopirellula marina]
MSQASPESTEYFVESIREDNVGLFVSFVKHQDRFGHVVALVQGEDCTPVFVSIEGAQDDDDWPESPPLQEVHLEQRGKNNVAMLVGKAGESHWSVAVEPTAEPGRIRFSIACRLQDYPMRICSRYGSILEEKLEPTLELDGPWVWKINGVELCVDVIPQDQFPTPEIPATPNGFEVNASLDLEPFPKTIQWLYEIWVR